MWKAVVASGARSALVAGSFWLAGGFPGVARAELPPEHVCPTLGTGTSEAPSEDARATLVAEGDRLGLTDLGRIRTLLPDEVWQHRGVFFFEGMWMQVGPCHRRYPVPKFFEDATAAHSANVRLDAEGNLEGYVAGLPFPPETIDASAPDAAARWAWDLALRYRGAGPTTRFRLVDMPGRIGSAEVYIGRFFLLQTKARADLVASGSDSTNDALWVAGGRFEEPTNARELAWRQIRDEESLADYRDVDDTFVYVPAMRKPRRGATAWVDGVYVPQFRVSGTDGGGGAVPFGSGQYGPESSIAPTAGLSIAAAEHLRRGFEGLTLRPNAYRWTLKGERDVLAPINSANPGWPENPDRNYGESGLSVANDVWDVRRAVVIEGVARRSDADEVARLTVYIDRQTQQPLYWITRKRNGIILDVGILVHRYSGDVAEYPEWPGGGRALVFDPVAASFFAADDGLAGWRRESYDARSVPIGNAEVERLTSTEALVKGR
ncbi:hypothetical protein MYXO_03468 [Myxococcaceae bacterium]|nr:hypothetical protein MYXO_03468 [Myxococcaceae bacterium]